LKDKLSKTQVVNFFMPMWSISSRRSPCQHGSSDVERQGRPGGDDAGQFGIRRRV
jgi:hypothetical protein